MRDKRFDGDVSIDDCRRCKGAHDNLRAQKFINPPDVSLRDPFSRGRDPTHWTMCPTTGEPILLFTKRNVE